MAGKIVALTILISTFSAANSVILTAPRVFYAMAKDKLFFMKLAEVHPRFKTPAAAIMDWASGRQFWCVLVSLGTFSKLIEGVIFIGWIFYGLGAARHFPPFAAPRPTAQFLIVFLAILGRLYSSFSSPRSLLATLSISLSSTLQIHESQAAIVLFLIGLPAYFFWRKRAA